MDNFNEIQQNWNTFEKLCRTFEDPGIEKLLEDLGERLIMCPASNTTDQAGCHPGGLIQHVLDVTATMRKINNALKLNLDTTSVLKVGLLHDIGKVGDETTSYFVEQDSDWHREKLGQFYKYNEELEKMSTSHRTLYLLQAYNIKLNRDEWLAIQLAQGSHFEENRFYVRHEPALGLILQQSKAIISNVKSS